MRADYERTIVQADHDYALTLADAFDGLLSDLADAIGQHKRAAIDRVVAVESPRFASLSMPVPTSRSSARTSGGR